jgi:hypothetical protein
VFNAPNGVAYQYSATYSSWLAQSAAPGVGPYLPLTGGTLAGPGTLVGTTATFGGVVDVGANLLWGTAAQRGELSYTTLATIVRSKGTNQLRLNYGDGSGGVFVYDGGGGMGALTGGTATFSGTVQTGNLNVVSGNLALSDGYYGYTPYNGATNTGQVRAGIQYNGNLQTLSFYTANTWRGNVEASGLLNWAGAATFSGAMSLGGQTTLTGTSATGGHLLFNDTNTGGAVWQAGPGSGSGSPDLWTIYNQGTSLSVLAINKNGTASIGASPPPASNDTSIATTAWARANISGGGSGKLLQTVYNRTGTGATGTTLIPFDTTIPQITEGDEYMTLAVTPTSATSLLIVDVVWIGSNSAVNNMGVALFKDATASALTAAAATVTAANATVNIKFKYIMVSGSTAATTFRVRAGGGAAGTTSFNSGTTFGFVMCSSMTIQEVTP